MSTAISVYDTNESFKKPLNFYMRSSTVDRKAVGGPVDSVPNRKCSNSSSSSTVLTPQFLRMNSAHPSSSSSMISLGTSTNLKFDRSLSEPSDTRLASSQNQLSHINSNKYKTELCRSYDESRQCKYGEKCRYAHGSTELRTPARHPKYKTEPCRTYHSSGFCPYGPRCHFIHNEYERKNTQSSNNASTNTGNGPTNINQNTGKENILQNGHGTTSNSSPSSSHTLFQNVLSQSNSLISNKNAANMNFGLLPKSSKFNSISSSSLGSTADSPPSSVTDSPTPSVSPLFFGDDFQGSNNLYTLSSSPSSSSGSMPLSASSSSNSISGIALDELFTAESLTKPFDLLTINEWSQDIATTESDHFLQDDTQFKRLNDTLNLLQDPCFFPDIGFDVSKLPYEFRNFVDCGSFMNY